MARVFHVSVCFSYDFEYFKLLILIFLLNLRLPIHPQCGDDARKRPINNDVTDSFAVGKRLWSACWDCFGVLFHMIQQEQ